MDHFGQQLLAAGYNYWGNEPMYSGITGEEFAADIYLGVVYYQRLRHMVNDKFQVRTTGPVDPVTRQPVKVRRLNILSTDSLASMFPILFPLTYSLPLFLVYLQIRRVESEVVVSVSVKWSVMR